MRYFFSSIILILSAIFATFATDSNETTLDPLEMSIDENLATPEVPKKAKKYVAATVDHLRRYFEKNGLHATPLREGEVLHISVSCSDLFGPCAVELRPSASEILRHFNVVVNEPQKYKLLVAVHSDDTGDDRYADSITAARANVIDDYLWQLVGEKDTNVIPYGIGKEEPLVQNNSRSNRATNRRVEFFIIPDNGLIRMSGVKK